MFFDFLNTLKTKRAPSNNFFMEKKPNALCNKSGLKT